MSEPDRRLQDEIARRWVAVADIDLRTIDACLAAGPPVLEAAAYHARQAVEKLLKALLCPAEIEFRKTHDLRELLRLADRHISAELVSMHDMVELTVWGIAFRYPFEEEPEAAPTVTELTDARARIHELRSAAAALLDR